MVTISDVATAISLIRKVIKAATDAQMMKKEFKELAGYLELIGGQLEMLDDRELGDASMQTFQKIEDVLLQCHDLADSCQQRSSIYLMVNGKRIQNELRGAQEKITKYLTLIPLIHFTQVFRRVKEGDTKIHENLCEHPSDESDIPELAAEGITEFTDNSFQSNSHLFTYEQRTAQCTKLPSMQGSREGSIVRSLILHCKRLFTRFEPRDNNFTDMPKLSFTYKQIVKMTLNFETIIGRGGFGTIYHGHLEDGTDVAIKLQTHSSQQRDREFLAELRLTQLHHKNLISLIGYCMDGSNRAIVYEYMPRGDLQAHLRGEKPEFPVLTWAQRLQIAYQAAQGLDYLHTGCNPPIVHRDVKSSNILLGADFVAKITDFGISKALNENDTDETTIVVGTLGYLDPEYAHTGHVSTASDVYGFGIILLEMITGQPAFIRGPKHHQDIFEWISLRVADDVNFFVDTSTNEYSDPMWKALQLALSCTDSSASTRRQMADFVDASMNENYDPSSARKVLQLALSCTKPSASRRPQMAEVAIQLKEIIEMKPFKQMTEDMNSEDMENEEVEEAFVTLIQNEEVEEAFVTSTAQADRPPPDMENEEVEEAFVTSIAQADRPICVHQLSANLFTSWTHNSPGRRFWRCKYWKMAGDDCGYFKWHDPVQGSVAIEQLDFVIHQIDELDEEIMIMDEESAILFCKLKDLEEKIAECKRSKEALEMKSDSMDIFYECM